MRARAPILPDPADLQMIRTILKRKITCSHVNIETCSHGFPCRPETTCSHAIGFPLDDQPISIAGVRNQCFPNWLFTRFLTCSHVHMISCCHAMLSPPGIEVHDRDIALDREIEEARSRQTIFHIITCCHVVMFCSGPGRHRTITGRFLPIGEPRGPFLCMFSCSHGIYPACHHVHMFSYSMLSCFEAFL